MPELNFHLDLIEINEINKGNDSSNTVKEIQFPSLRCLKTVILVLLMIIFES